MTLFPIPLVAALVLWAVFEVVLVLRDLINRKGRFGKDKGSRYVVNLGLFVGLFLGGGLRNPKYSFAGGPDSLGLWIGVAFLMVGLALRVWAVAALGRSFRLTVETHLGQEVVRSGPYRYVRHPAYGGLILICLGYGIALQNWLSLAFAVLFPVVTLLYRIHVEERALISSLGEDYERYQKETKRLIPWVW